MSHCPRTSAFLAPPPPLLFPRHSFPCRRRRPRGRLASRPFLTLARFDPPPLLRLKVSDSSDSPADAAHTHAHHSNHAHRSPAPPLLQGPRALIASLAPVWREGLFLVRCSVFAAVVSVAAALSWVAQLRARSFVEARLLPAASAALGEYLQREVRLGKVRSVSPLGITLQTCSVGPHAEEFSCAEVPVMKIRVRPFASLRRGKVVVDAVLSEPSVLVAQKKDFSWLGIPPPSEATVKRHSGEEGIDYRTKTRRLAREKAAEQWNEERDKAAREAAEKGYTIPSGQVVSSSTHEMLEVDGPTEVGKSSPPHCADVMHKKDHHLATGIDSGSKHADLEKSFGVKSRIPGINLWSRMISSPSRIMYRRKAHSKVVSDADNSSQQRILRRSADAAVAYFQSTGPSNIDDSSPGAGKSSSDGGHANVGGGETTSNDEPVGSSGIASMNLAESPLDNLLSSQCGSCNLDNEVLLCHHLEDLEIVQANFPQGSVLEKFDKSYDHNCVSQKQTIFGNFGSCTHAQNLVPFWPFQLKGFPVSFNAPCASLDVQIQKLKSQFVIGPGDIFSAEFTEGVSQTHPAGVQHALPITLDTVYFNGGNLMLLGYGDQEPRQKYVGSLVFVLKGDFHVQLFERILEIPVVWHKGRATGEVHICMSKDDSFPSIHGQIDVKGLAFQILDAPSSFSDIVAKLSFRGQRVFLHNASGWFGDAPVEASGDFGLNPEDGEFHLMCQVPSVEVNALMRTMKTKPLMFPLAGAVTAVFNCQGPLDAPVFVGSGIVSRKSLSISGMPPSAASEAVMQNKEAGAVAAFDHIPFSHVSANFTFNLDNCVADLYGIRACLLDGGEIRGAGNAWICPEGEVDDSAMDINLSGTILLDKVLHRYIPGGTQPIPLKIGELNGETRLSGSLNRPKFDIKWAAPNAEDSFSDARGNIVIAHDYIMVNSSSVAFDLNTRVQTSYIDDYLLNKRTYQMKKIMPLIVEGVDLDLRMRGFEFAHIASSIPFDSPRPLHLKASGRVKFQGKIMKSSNIADDKIKGILQSDIDQNEVETNVSKLVGNISLSGIKLNQLMLAPESTGSLSISRHSVMVRNLPLDELEFASLRGFVQKAELQLNFQKRRGHGVLSVIRPKFSGMLGEALDIAARWSGDVITMEKSILEQANSKYELQGEYVFPGTRDRFPVESQSNGFIEKAMGGHLGSIMSSMGRWRMRLEVPGAEVAEMLPLARLLSRSTDPVIRSRSKELFMQCLQSVGFHAESLRDQLKALEMYHDWLDDDTMEDITLPGLAELRGYWRGSLDASGGGNGDTMGDLKGTLAKPECDVKIRLLDGTIGGIDLGRAEVLASVTPTSRFVFDANFEPTIQSGHVNIQGSIPVTYVDSSSTEESMVEEDGKQGEVRINADIKDGGMMLITALSPYANWLQGYADVLLQVKGTVDQPVVDGSATFNRAIVDSPFLRTPLTNFAGTIQVISNRLCVSSMESRVGRKGKLSMKGSLPLKNSEPSANDKIDLKCEVLDIRAKNILSGQIDSQLQVTGSILRPDVSGMIRLSHGEAYLPHDKGNGPVATRLASNKSSYLASGFDQSTTSQDVSRILGSLSASPESKYSVKFERHLFCNQILLAIIFWLTELHMSVLSLICLGEQSDTERTLEHGSFKPNIDARLNDLKLMLGPELRIVYPLILNFAVSGDLELSGMVHPKYIRPKGILTFENGEVNLVATQVRLKNDHLNVAKFEPDLGLDPILDLVLVGSEWQFKIQSRASMWQDNLVVTSTRSVDQDVLSPSEAAKVFESQLAESLLEGDGQLAFKKLATATLETLMPRIEGKGEFGQARWRLVYAPQIPSLLSVDPTVDPLKSLANNISFATEVEVQLGKRLQASVVRQMKDSEMAMQWTLIYQLTSRLRVLFQSTPSNRLLFEYSATSQD
nr:unnamed protein product [Digitaria exilis]